jgi:hypothetical protein
LYLGRKGDVFLARRSRGELTKPKGKLEAAMEYPPGDCRQCSGSPHGEEQQVNGVQVADLFRDEAYQEGAAETEKNVRYASKRGPAEYLT